MKLTKTIYLSLLGLIGATSFAQEFTSDIQIRPRYEYTNGFGTLLTPTTEHTSFVGQRTRANFNYTEDKLKIKLALQNVHTWGDQKTATTTSKNGFAAFEAWAQYSFSANWSAKLGRQPLSYDSQRVIGGLDWANQARSFDAALIKYKGEHGQLDLGFALNAESEDKIAPASPYNTDGVFNNMQHAWYNRSYEKASVSLLVMNVGTEYQRTPSDVDLSYFQTFGIYGTHKSEKLFLDYSLYGQTGKIATNTVSAWEASLNVGGALSAKLTATAGYEFLSGKDQGSSSTMVKSFSPLFGTNHKFNGFMDYFYVGNHANSVGLHDLNLKFDFPINKVNCSVASHAFAAPNKIYAAGVEQDSYLGTEFDLTVGYKIDKNISLTAGYSHMFATDSMVALKGGLNDTTNNWAYVMVNFNPQIFTTKQ